MACFDDGCNSVVIEWDLRNQNDVRATGDPAVQCDPAGMTSHHFHDHDAFMTDGGSVQPIERVHHCRNCRIKSEGRRRGFEIVIDRFWDTDAIDARFLQLVRRDHGTVSTDDNQCFHPQVIQNAPGILDYFRWNNRALTRTDFSHEMATIGGTDDRPAQRNYSVGTDALDNEMSFRP